MQTIAAFTGPLKPDLPARDNPGVIRAENCLPLATSFEPARNHVPDMDALPSPCVGARSVQDFALDTFSYAGTATDLYERISSTWNNVGTGYSAQTWEFDTFNDRVYAANGSDLLQSATMGSTFADIADAPPSPKHITVARNFLIAGNMPGDPRTVQWSALGDGETWTPDGTNQAGSQTLRRGGAVTRIIGGEYAVVFCEHSIYTMRFVGGAIIWQFDEVQPARGTLSGGSVTQIGYNSYYLGDDGFYVFDGTTATTIGTATMNQAFINDYDSTLPDAISSLVDLNNTLVYWAYPGSGNSGIANKVMVYNYATDRWAGPISIQLQRLTYSQLPSVLSDTVPPGDTLSDDIDTLSDAQEFKGGSAQVTGFNNMNEHGTFTGSNMTALVESGEFALQVGGKALLRSVRALVDGASPIISIAVGTRDSASGTVSYTTDKTPSAETGKAKYRANARFHRIKITVSGDFTHIFGAEPESTVTSRR